MDERPALQLPDITPRAIAAADEITFIGTATTLIKVAGFSILTDPNFLQRGDRAYVGMGLSTKATDRARAVHPAAPGAGFHRAVPSSRRSFPSGRHED